MIPLLLLVTQSGTLPDEWCTEVFPPHYLLQGGGHGQERLRVLPRAGAHLIGRAGPGAGHPPQTLRIAIETDYEFWSNWGSTTLATNYVHGLIGAANDLYCSQVGVRLQLAYLGIWDTPADPWTATTTSGRLDEFRAAWAPINADAAHFLSGASLGGGISFVDVLCNESFAFSVSGNIVGNIYWPNWDGTAQPENWDFIVFTHELAHSLGARHTQFYCPPLDHCVSNCDGFISCSQGTIMSYCHTCPFGQNMTKIDPVFHPFNAETMRQSLAESCLTGMECW